MSMLAASHLLELIDAHRRAEEEHIAAYRDLVRTSRDPVIATLIDLILEDEERHHDLLRRMAARLRDDIDLRHAPGSLGGRAPYDPAAGNLAAATREFAQEEREGARKLRQLAHDGQDVQGGLFSLLLETMAHDSEKHEKILRFVLERLAP